MVYGFIFAFFGALATCASLAEMASMWVSLHHYGIPQSCWTTLYVLNLLDYLSEGTRFQGDSIIGCLS